METVNTAPTTNTNAVPPPPVNQPVTVAPPVNTEKGSILDQVENFLDQIFGKKAPPLPQNIKEILVKLAPFGEIALLLFALPALLAVFGLGTLLYTVSLPFGSAHSTVLGIQGIISMVFTIGILIMRGVSIPGLFARSRTGWKWSYYAEMAGTISAIVLSFNFSVIITAAIGFYILFQIKEYYK